MTWQRFDLRFRLESPLHIGRRKSGNLQETRGYVPGKNMWAALTARLTRDFDDGSDGRRYVCIGGYVQAHFRFGYLYPALQIGRGYIPHYPWQEDNFGYLFLDSYTSAALDYPSQSAAEGLLHETEFIAPRTRDDRPVYLVGALYMLEPLPAPLHQWQEALARLQFGAEQGYGWGRVKQENPLVGAAITGDPMGDVVDGRITAHLEAKDATGVAGPIEPLIGWERNNKGGNPWQLSDKAVICYAPGATVTTGRAFVIGAQGVWHPSPQDHSP